MRLTRTLVSAAICATACGAAFAQPLETLPPDTPLATVGGVTIRAGDVLRETAHRFGLGVLHDIVAEKAIEARCAAAGIKVDPGDVPPGMSRHMALFSRLFAAQIEPTEDEARRLFDSKPEIYRPRVVAARGILFGSEDDARKLLLGALTEDSFAQYARDVSIHPSGADGGDLGTVSSLAYRDEPEVAAALFGEGQPGIVGPVKSTAGWWVFLRGTPERGPIPTFDEVRPVVIEELRRAKFESLWNRRWLIAPRGVVTMSIGSLWTLVGERPPAIVPPGLSAKPSTEGPETGGANSEGPKAGAP
jgi:hypothetical protein